MRFHKRQRSTYTNFLLAKYEMYTRAVAVKSYPYYVGIDPASVCNLRCPTCATGVEYESARVGNKITYRTRTRLSTELFDSLLEEMGDYLFLIMFYNWGEPLLNKNLPEMVRKASDRNIETDVHTNLSLRVSDQFLEDLLMAGLGQLGASLDGFTQNTYELYRRGGNLSLAMDNLERVVRIRNRLALNTRIVWNFLVFSFNEHEIPAVKRYCDELGIGFNARDAWIDNPDWLPSYRQSEVSASLVGNESIWVPSGVAEDVSLDCTPCGWHYGYTMINADGSISPCCASWDQKDDLGKLSPQGTAFSDVWNNLGYRSSRAAFANKPLDHAENVRTLCANCPFDKSVQNLYSLFDSHVIMQFNDVLRGSDPLLDQAFGLLDDHGEFVRLFEEHIIALVPPRGDSFVDESPNVRTRPFTTGFDDVK